MATKKEQVKIYLSAQDHKDLKEIAQREHRSVSNLIEVWVAEHRD